MKEMTRLKIDDYVINDHHVNSSYGLGHFAENGAFVKDEFLDLVDDVNDKKKFYIKEKKIRDKYKKKVIPKVVKKAKQKFTDNLKLK